MRTWLWPSLVVLLAGCPQHLKATLLPPGSAAREAGPAAPGYDHEVLFDSDRWLFYAERDEVFSEHQVHVVMKVLTEKGRDVAAQKSNWHRKAKLVDIAGQVIAPDGKVSPLEQSQVFWTADPDSDNGRASLAFQLPNVSVGSVVEYSYVIRWEGIITEANRDLDERVPIRHYEVEVTKSSRLDYVLRAYHTHKDFEVADEGDFRHVRWSFDGYQPPRDDDYVDFEGPRWLYRNTAVGWSGKYYPVANGWGGVYQFDSQALDVADDWTRDFNPSLDLTGCVDARCKVERAWAETHRLTDNSGTGHLWDSRPLKAVVASGQANSFEQVLLFRRLLAAAGLISDTVFVTRVLGRPFDKTFPNSLHDDVVAWVRPAEGLGAGLFVDASCEYCAPGVLRDVVDGADGVRAWAVRRRAAEPEYHGEWVTVRGDGRAADGTQTERHVTVSESGDLEVHETATGLGAEAALWRQQARGKDEVALRQEQERAATSRYPQASLEDFSPLRCDKAKGRCERTRQFKVEKGATRAGDELVVPLAMFGLSHANTFLPPTRAEGIRVSGEHTLRESVTLELPVGWKVDSAPKPFVESAAGFSANLEVREGPGTLTLVRTLVRKQGRWPASDYAAARGVVRSYAGVRQQAVVLSRPR